ncbi:MAG: 4Fe-4S dicluster domain-containing protein [Rikenellaceae bacterium]
MNKLDFIDIVNNNIIYKKVILREPSIRNCIGCGKCVATCEAAFYTDFSMRKVIYKVRRGDVANINKLTKLCMLCSKCSNICPEGVNTKNIILIINELSSSLSNGEL